MTSMCSSLSDTESRLRAAASFLRAARVGPRAADLPEEVRPRSVEEAYRIQDLVIGSAPVAGWKTGATAAPEALSCAPIAAADRILDGGSLAGAAALELEVEVAIRIAADLPPRAGGLSAATVASALGAAHLAFEIVESRYLDREAATSLSTLADGQSSRGFVVAPEGVDGWRERDLARLPIQLMADGVEVARAGAPSADAERVLAALTWLANHAAARGPGLRAGQFVITGARIGPIPMPRARRISASAPGFGAVSLDLG